MHMDNSLMSLERIY